MNSTTATKIDRIDLMIFLTDNSVNRSVTWDIY